MSANDTIPTIIPQLFEAFRMAFRQQLNAKQLGLNAMIVKCVTIIATTPDCTAHHICITLNRDKAQIARLVKEMMVKGWVSKQPSTCDKRSYILTLTDAGLVLREQIQSAKETIHAQIEAGLSEQEIATFHRISEKIANNLSVSANETVI